MNIVTVDGAVARRIVNVGVQGPPGPSGPSGVPFRGLTTRVDSGTINFSAVTIGEFVNSGLTGTLNANVSVDAVTAGVDKFGLKRTGSGLAWCHVIATADVAGASTKRIAIRLALNGVPITESECNITITPTTIGKLHTMFIFELGEGDEVTVWFANKTNQQAAVIERARMTLFGIA